MPRRATAAQVKHTLGSRLRQARLAANITQAEVAKDLFSVSYVSAVERDMIRPSLGALEKLSDRLNIPMSELLRDDDDGGARTAGGTDPEDSESLLREAQIHLRRGEPRECIALIKPLLDHGLSLRDTALAQYVLASALDAVHEYEAAMEAASDSIAIIERLGDVEARERTRLLLGTILSHQHHYEAAITQLRTVEENIDSGIVQDPVTRVRLLVQLGMTLRAAGDADEAARQLRLAVDAAQPIDEATRLSETYARLSAHARVQGDTKLARLFSARSLAALDEADRRRVVGLAYAQLGRSLADAGKLDEAEAALHTALARADETQDSASASDAHSALSAVWLQRGQLRQAAEEAQHALAAASDGVTQAEALVSLARIHYASKDLAKAAERFEEAIPLLKQAHDEARLSDLYAEYSSHLEKQGQSQRALEMLREAWQLRAAAIR
jgi:tetratricopeptide (TPR) repeat protein